jgi:NADH-quinone oxidoreductase subunit C
VDYKKNLEVVYHVNSYRNHCIAQIRVEVPSDDPSIDTVSDIWGGANWHEREAMDMFGITFKGHPDPRRILLPEDADYHPLLKSFKISKKNDWNVEDKTQPKEGEA